MLAPNTVSGGAPLEVHGAVFEPRRFGGALVLRRPYDYARGPACGARRAGAVSFWFRLDAPPQGTELLNIQGTLSVMVDAAAGTGLVAQLGDRILLSGRQIEPGHWHHVVLAFDPNGATLYLDGEAVARDPNADYGLTVGLCRDEYLAVGALGEPFTPFAIDALALFDRCLDEAQVQRLALDDYEPSPASGQTPQPRSIQADDYVDRSDPTCGFQQAVDALGAAGGVVTLPPGRYLLRRPLVLHSHVTLHGAAGQTILAAPVARASALGAHAQAGQAAVRVDDASVFRAGRAVVLRSDVNRDWHATAALVERCDDSTLNLSRPLSTACMTFDHALAVTWFPLIVALRRHDVHVTDLVVEGVPQAPAHTEAVHQPVARNCPAIHLLDCVDATVQRCRVAGWPHDGIGVHGGARISVSDCVATHCLGHGLCVDGPARLTQWLGNRAEGNQMDGMCLGPAVRDSLVAHGIFHGNAGYGIGGAEQDLGATNLIDANHCRANRRGASA